MTQILNYADPGTTKGTAVATFFDPQRIGQPESWTLIGLCLVKSRPAVPGMHQNDNIQSWQNQLYIPHKWGQPTCGPCLYELPQVYPYGKQSLSRMTAGANDLIAIAARGAAVAEYMSSGQGTGSIKPREWKGQVKKPQHHRKALQVLSLQETQLLADAFDDDIGGLQNYVIGACHGGPYSSLVVDLLDAVALGLSDNGRLRIV